MEKCVNNSKAHDNIKKRATNFRCIFKQPSISSSLTLPIRIAPAWGRVLRFGQTTKFKTDEFFQVKFTFCDRLLIVFLFDLFRAILCFTRINSSICEKKIIFFLLFQFLLFYRQMFIDFEFFASQMNFS